MMTSFKRALDESSTWLTIPGVEAIIPNTTDQSIMVLTSCSSLFLTELIPEYFQGYMVNLYYIHGLNINDHSEQTHPLNKADNF